MKNKGILPLPVFTRGRGEKKKEHLVSLNNFFPMHFIQKNNVKRAYHDTVMEWVHTLPKYKTIQPHYKLYFKTKHKRDLDNYTFTMHKFLMDALVEGEVIEDDHYEIVTKVTTEIGGLDDDNYVVVEIKGEELGTEQEQGHKGIKEV